MARLRQLGVEPLRGRCYLSYLEIEGRTIATRRSLDGGLTWSEPVAPAPGPASGRVVNGAQPLVQPDGALTVVFVSLFGTTAAEDEILATRSTDGGATFTPAYTVAGMSVESLTGIRADPLPTAAVDGSGRLYVGWQDCRFSEDASTTGSWSRPRATGSRGRRPCPRARACRARARSFRASRRTP
jgi:hypothetical protein